MSSKLSNFDLSFAIDDSTPFVLDIHNNNSENLTFHSIPQPNPKLTGSQKRKRLSRPEKFDGKQFRIALLEGNETENEIKEMKAKASLNEIDEKFFEKQTKICENFLNDFLKKCKNDKAAEMKQIAREAAVNLYEAVEFEDLPLDVPHVASEVCIIILYFN